MPCNIYRLGRVTGDSVTGACNPNDMFYRFIRSCIKMGCFPEHMPAAEITPVDIVVKGIVYLSLQNEFSGRVFHVFNPDHVPPDFLFAQYQKGGAEVRSVSLEQWLGLIEESSTQETPLPILPYLPMFKQNAINIQGNNNKETPVIMCKATMDCLQQGGIHYPAVDERLIKAYLTFLRELEARADVKSYG
jgi:thioester reductase-like protein